MSVRYITRGLIDGSLSTLGIVIGAAISADPKVVIAAGFGGGIANAVSNLLGALMAEKASVMQRLDKYERSMVGSNIRLKDTKIYEKEKIRIWKGGSLDGASTFFGSVVPVIPFFLMPIETAVLVAIGITLSMLFVLGMYLGRLSKDNIFWGGAKMAIFGGLTAILASSLEMFFG